jgi:hypothetical protein
MDLIEEQLHILWLIFIWIDPDAFALLGGILVIYGLVEMLNAACDDFN